MNESGHNRGFQPKSKFSLGSVAKKVAVLSFVLLAISACATHAPTLPITPSLDARYKASTTPPPGHARVYILPVFFHNLIGDGDVPGDIYLGRSEVDKVLIGGVDMGKFLAFDAPAGRYDVSETPYADVFTPSSQMMNLANGETLFLRPLAYGSGAGAGVVGAAIAAAVNDGTPQFEFLNPADGLARIQSMTMVSLTPQGQALVSQGAPPAASNAKARVPGR